MLSPEEMRVLDANARHYGVSILDLMERAGRGVADVVLRDFHAGGKRVLVLCGTGNNGGDGFVAARYLANDAAVAVLLARDPDAVATDPARRNLERLPQKVDLAVAAPPFDALLRDADVVVDALLGIGVQGELREPYASLVAALAACGKPVVAVDVPSGFGTDRAFRPAATVTMHDVKEGMTEANCGAIHVVDIGIPPEVEERVGPGEFLLYPRPDPESHKGQNGRVLVVGGGPYTGAPGLAALAAYRMGADLVHVATPARAHPIVASFSPNLIVHALEGDGRRFVPDDVDRLHALLPLADAVVVGPGAGDAEETKETLRRFLAAADVPVVVDADGLVAVAEDPECLKGKAGVVTPHAREFADLAGESLPEDAAKRKDAVRTLARRLGVAVLLKGRTDVISDGERVKVNPTGNAAMTVGGTGDVLAGLVGALLAKGVAPYDAARMAAFANGTAGDMAFEEVSYGMVSSDLLAYVPRVLKRFLPKARP
jgi:NAD(P)H-hydrate epimerase